MVLHTLVILTLKKIYIFFVVIKKFEYKILFPTKIRIEDEDKSWNGDEDMELHTHPRPVPFSCIIVTYTHTQTSGKPVHCLRTLLWDYRQMSIEYDKYLCNFYLTMRLS